MEFIKTVVVLFLGLLITVFKLILLIFLIPMNWWDERRALKQFRRKYLKEEDHG